MAKKPSLLVIEILKANAHYRKLITEFVVPDSGRRNGISPKEVLMQRIRENQQWLLTIRSINVARRNAGR